ncbi:MAG: hypothetical protein WDW36_004859 [Sanguina aurantia]
MEPPDDYWDAEDFDDNDELEELVLESYLGNLIFEPPATPDDPTTTPLKPRLHRRLLHKLVGPEGILLRDKLAFVLGSTLLWVCAFTLGRTPQTFYRLYTGLGVALMGVRYFTYRRSRRHYYLFDICYFANLLLVTHVWLLRRSALLQTVTFAFNAGPVMWSIVAFRNSCVFHDLDKVTSLYLHLVPAMVSWTLRWYPTKAFYGFPSHEALGAHRPATSRGGVVSLVLVPAVFYTAWAVAYYLKIFVISASRIKERGYQTLFGFVTTQRKGVFHAIAKRVRPSVQPAVYFALHMLFCLTTFVISIAAWHSYYVHTLLLLLCASMSMWHGAQYYFEVFAGR